MNERMLINELHKVEREIRIHGKIYVFNRNVLDEYKEPTGQEQKIATACGLFHISKQYSSKTTTEGSSVHSKGQPKLMLKYCDCVNVQNGDFVVINSNKYIVVEKNNLQEMNIVCDISLELVLDGKN